jgi:four helix bundle protein
MFVAYTVSLELIRSLRSVVAQLRRYSPEAAEQVERAASSIAHNLAEGSRRNGRDPKRFFAMAHGSAAEVRGALDVADAWGWEINSQEARALLDRELGLLWGLTRRHRAGSSKKVLNTD